MPRADPLSWIVQGSSQSIKVRTMDAALWIRGAASGECCKSKEHE
jgi:hypothetical protein